MRNEAHRKLRSKVHQNSVFDRKGAQSFDVAIASESADLRSANLLSEGKFRVVGVCCLVSFTRSSRRVDELQTTATADIVVLRRMVSSLKFRDPSGH